MNIRKLSKLLVMLLVMVALTSALVFSASASEITVPTTLYPESSHPYTDNYDNTQTFTYPGATELILTFSSQTAVENRYDHIYLYDGEDNQITSFTGTQAAGATTTVPGDTFKIRLVTDSSNTAYGYSFSSIVAVMPDSGCEITLPSSGYPESSHNYSNNINITKTYTYPGATALQLTFNSQTRVEGNYDYIYLYDGNSDEIARYTGTQAAGVTVTVLGDTFKIKLTSDSSQSFYGYSFDSIVALMHTYDDSCDESCNTCGDTRSVPHSYDSACDTDCNACGATRVTEHIYTNVCDPSCNICGATRDAKHTYLSDFDTACTICGTGRTPPCLITVPSSQYPESDHNYDDNIDETQTFTYPGATKLRLTFSSQTKVESRYDNLYLYDGNDTLLATYTGTEAASKTITLSGDSFKIRLTSDSSSNYYGYSFSSIIAVCHTFDNTCDNTCNKCDYTRDAQHTYDHDCDADCNICGETRTTTHGYDDEYDMTCNACGVKRPISFNGWVSHDGWRYGENGYWVTGWKKLGGSWYYFNADGIMQTGWLNAGGHEYYLKTSGVMAIGWCKVGSDYYFFDANGYMVKNKWKQDSNGWMYLGADGRMYANKWMSSGSKWYYFKSNGYMAIGWAKVGSSYYYFDNNGFMVTNKWMQDSNGWMYINANGVMVANGWASSGGNWYYMNGNGYMVKNSWVNVNGWYYLDKNGVMKTNCWAQHNGNWRFLGANGCAVTNGWGHDSTGWFYLDGNGYQIKNQWIEVSGVEYYMDRNGYMKTNSWVQQGSNWRYVNANGAMVKSNWVSDGGYWYYMDRDGDMAQNAYWKIDGKLYYFFSDGKLMANQTFRSGYVGADGVIGDQCFAYLAAADFRREKSDYPSTVARCGYVHADIRNGALWVVTIVYYRIGTYNYYIETLHDLTNGKRITSPADYYEELADYYSGSTRLKYLQYAIDVLEMEQYALKYGAYITPAYLSQ